LIMGVKSGNHIFTWQGISKRMGCKKVHSKLNVLQATLLTHSNPGNWFVVFALFL